METGPVILKARLHYGNPAFGYLLAVALVTVSGTGRLALMSGGDTRAPLVLFYPAIGLASYLAGAGPGLLALLASAAFSWLILPVVPSPGSWIGLSVLGPLLVSASAHLREMRETSRATALESARFRFVSDHAGDLLLLIGENGGIAYANRMAIARLGAGLTGRSLETFAPDWQKPGLRRLLASCRSGEPVTTEIALTQENGSTFLVEAGFSAVRTGEETVIHMSARDITERREMEAKLREAQKWEGLGVMAGGLAHDFNNLLTSILGNASLAREFPEDASAVARHLAEIEKAGEKSADLVRLMLATAGYRPAHPETLPVESILEQMLATGNMPEHVRVNTEIEVRSLSGDRRSMGTLLWSLISNAAEAYGPAPGEVTVRICAGSPPLLGPASFEEGSATGDGCVGIIVEDRGCGMTKEVLDRAFDPFFTTKFMGRGLGLPAVRGLVRAHSGKLWLKTGPGEGTRVEVWLPKG